MFLGNKQEKQKEMTFGVLIPFMTGIGRTSVSQQ